MCNSCRRQVGERSGPRCRREKEKAGWPLNVLPCARITSIRFKGTLSVGACLAVVPTPPAVDRVDSLVAVGVAVAIVEGVRGCSRRVAVPQGKHPSTRGCRRLHHC